MGSWEHLYKMGHEIKDQLKVRMKEVAVMAMRWLRRAELIWGG